MTIELIVKTGGWIGMTGVMKESRNEKEKEKIEMNGGWIEKRRERNEN